MCRVFIALLFKVISAPARLFISLQGSHLLSYLHSQFTYLISYILSRLISTIRYFTDEGGRGKGEGVEDKILFTHVMIHREARRWTPRPDASCFLRYFHPKSNGILHLWYWGCWEEIWPVFQANVMTKQKRISIVLTINIMQLWGMSWRVVRSFKTCLYNDILISFWLFRRLLIYRGHQSKKPIRSRME